MSKYNLRYPSKKGKNTAKKSQRKAQKISTDTVSNASGAASATMQSADSSPVPNNVDGATSEFENGANTTVTNDIPDSTKSAIDQYFKQATNSFHAMVKDAMESLLDNVRRVERELGKAIEFEGRRIDDLERKEKASEKKIVSMENELDQLREKVLHMEADINKGERFSRRNNFRLVGVEEVQNSTQEDCVSVVEGILRDKFGLDVNVERAHRDGGKRDDRPRHILVKTLSYRHKTQVMKNARAKLKDDDYFIVDDLTKKDLEEKRKWAEKVKELYKNGTKLRFYAGKWRGNGGEPFEFK